MERTSSRKRPWLAALLAVLATGLGHFYLRRRRRAFGWLLAAFAASVLFVDAKAIDALWAGAAVDPLTLLPLAIVGGLSAVDAYLLAQIQNRVSQPTADADRQLTNCPRCGKELDRDLEFCHWCTTEIVDPTDGHSDDPADSNEL